MHKIIWLFVFAQAADLITTLIGLSIGLRELNPILTNVPLMVIGKLVGTIFIVLILKFLSGRMSKTPKIIYVLAGLSGLVAIWNALVILSVIVA